MVALLQLDVIEIAMKSATFLGVVVSAAALVARPSRRSLAWGAAGVALMVANAWLGAWGLVLDLAYLACAARMAWAPAPRRTTFTVVAVAD